MMGVNLNTEECSSPSSLAIFWIFSTVLRFSDVMVLFYVLMLSAIVYFCVVLIMSSEDNTNWNSLYN